MREREGEKIRDKTCLLDDCSRIVLLKRFIDCENFHHVDSVSMVSDNITMYIDLYIFSTFYSFPLQLLKTTTNNVYYIYFTLLYCNILRVLLIMIIVSLMKYHKEGFPHTLHNNVVIFLIQRVSVLHT